MLALNREVIKYFKKWMRILYRVLFLGAVYAAGGY